MKIKSRVIITVLLTPILILSGCLGQFDAEKYIRGALKNIYLGDPSEYMEMVDITEEEAKEEYEQGIEIEADYFLQYYGIDTVSEDVYQQIIDMYKNIYQQAKFDVQEATRDGDAYLVEVLISPIDIILNSENDIVAAIDEFAATADPTEYTDNQVLRDETAQIVIDTINRNMPDLGWMEEKSVIVKVEKDAAGYYGLSNDAVSMLDQEMIAY